MLAGLITALAAVVSDQASKALVFGFLAETQPVVAVTPFFNLVSAWNTGVSFSMFDNLGGAGVYILSAFFACGCRFSAVLAEPRKDAADAGFARHGYRRGNR